MKEEEIFSSLTISDKILLVFFVSLSGIEKAIGEIPTARSVMRQVYCVDPDYFKGNKDSVVERIFFRLFEKRFIERIEKAESKKYQLTSEGLDYLFRKFPQIRIKQKNFDGFWRIIVYDIEETERKLRNQVRRGLKSLGFRMIQKSVWASPYDWEEEIDEFLKKIKLEEDALIFQAKLSEDKTGKLLRSYWPDLLASGSKNKMDVKGSDLLRSLLSSVNLPEGLSHG